jgi:hypothetical protein
MLGDMLVSLLVAAAVCGAFCAVGCLWSALTKRKRDDDATATDEAIEQATLHRD